MVLPSKRQLPVPVAGSSAGLRWYQEHYVEGGMTGLGRTQGRSTVALPPAVDCILIAKPNGLGMSYLAIVRSR